MGSLAHLRYFGVLFNNSSFNFHLHLDLPSMWSLLVFFFVTVFFNILFIFKYILDKILYQLYMLRIASVLLTVGSLTLW